MWMFIYRRQKQKTKLVSNLMRNVVEEGCHWESN